jgi:hypothetical protein
VQKNRPMANQIQPNLNVATVDKGCGDPLGLGSGDRFEAFQGGSGSFRERVLQAKKPVELQDVLELAAADDQQPVETLAADAADLALRVCVRVRHA